MKKATITLSLVLLVTALFFACKKENNTTSTPTTTTTSGTTTGGGGTVTASSPVQVSYTMNGTNYSYVVGTGNLANGYGTSASVGTGTTTASYSMYITDAITSQYPFSIEKGTLTHSNGSIASDASFDGFFTLTSLAYSNNAANGIELKFDNLNYSTSNGSQSGSTFTIVDKVAVNQGGTHFMKIKANFSCKIYDSNGLNAKTITNGVLVAQFENM